MTEAEFRRISVNVAAGFSDWETTRALLVEMDYLRARVAELERDAARLDAIDSGDVEIRRGTMSIPTAPGRAVRTIPAWEAFGPGGTKDVAAYLRDAIDRATGGEPELIEGEGR